MDELFVSAFKALIQLGGSGWLVAAIELLGLIYLYRENSKTRDRAEAIGERTVIALERVTAVNQNVATTLDGTTKSREDMVRLLAEVARRGEESDKRSVDSFANVAVQLRTVDDQTRNNGEAFRRVYENQDQIADVLHQFLLELARAGLTSQPTGPAVTPTRRRLAGPAT